jgi:hypothetical protein
VTREPTRDLTDILRRLEEALRSPDALARIRAEVSELRARVGTPAQDVLPPLDRPVDLASVARFVREVIVRAHAQAGRVVVAPLVPVIGLPGSGKTSFLTTLGHILAEQRSRYHFPYEGEFLVEPLSLAELVRSVGGEAAHAEVLRPWILDFGWDFARRRFDAFFRHASWPPRTPPSQGARFLVAQVRKDGAPYARLVSVDVAGEDLLPIFRAGSEPDPLAAFRAIVEGDATPTGVAADSLDRATGIVLLIDSTRPTEKRAEAHKAFFELMARALRTRAQTELRALALTLEDEERTGDRTTLAGCVHRLRRSHKRFGEELCIEVEADLLGALAAALEPPGVEHRSEAGRSGLRRFLRDLAAVPDEVVLLKALGSRLAQGLARPEEGRRAPELAVFDGWSRAAARLRGVPLEVARRIATAETVPGAPELFRSLRGLSIVETKADVGRPLSPFQLLDCGPRLEEIRAALRLTGGDLRTYETSVVGYATLRGARYAPGPYATQTPINVLEPVFDLLGVPRDEGTQEPG